MPTMKDFLISRSTLPTGGTTTYKEHFQSFISSVTAAIGGSIKLAIDTTDYKVNYKTYPIKILTTKATTEISSSPQNLTVDGTKQVHIIIDPSC